MSPAIVEEQAHYYEDATRAYTFRVIKDRLGRDARYQRFVKDGVWTRGLKGARMVPYRLPELIEAGPEAVVLLCEHEAHADHLAALGLTTTALPATGHWAAEHARQFAGRSVVMVPIDGGEYSAKEWLPRAVEQLAGMPAEVRVGNPDWHDTATVWTPEEILEEAAKAPIHSSTARQSDDVRIIRLSEIEAKAMQWLWSNVIPLGKLTLLAGDPGLGKTFLALDLIARATTGRPMPGREENPEAPGSAILLSAEDDAADTLVPRLIAAGADMERVVSFQVRTGKDTFGLPTLADIPALDATLDQVDNPRMVVIDPVAAFVGSTNDHKNAELRGLLAPLAELAARRGVAIILVTHLSKGAGGKALYRATGSLAYAAAARACWLVCKDREEPARRLFLPFKCNLSIDPKGREYSLVEGRVAWGNESNIDADEALASDGEKSARTPLVARAMAWLSELLSGGAKASEDILAEGNKLGYKRDTLFKAKDQLGIKARKTGYGAGAGWEWELPTEASKGRSVEGYEASGESVSSFDAWPEPIPEAESKASDASTIPTLRPFEASEEDEEGEWVA